MPIKRYKDANDIEEKYLVMLAERQAECWGAKPFEEYRICKSDDCKAIFSTEEVLGDALKIRVIRGVDFECTECGSQTEEMYETEYFVGEMKKFFLGEVTGLLILDESEQVGGFGVLSKTTVRGLMEVEFNTRVSSYDKEQTIIDISRILYDSENAENEDIICFHQIYLSPVIRNSHLSYEALKALFEINREDYKNIPLIGEPRYDNRFYPILRSIGWENITHDQYGYVIQYLRKYGDMLDFLDRHNGYQSFLGDMIKYKRESRSIIKDQPELSGRKFYK